MTPAQSERIIAGAFITDGDGRLLLLQRAADEFLPFHWEVPSGHVESGESLADALRREVSEEVGAQVREIGPMLASFRYLSGSGKPTEQLTFHVLCDTPLVVRLSEEHMAYRWLTNTDAVPEPMTDETKGIIREFFRLRPNGKFQHGAETNGAHRVLQP